jgi:hypothetical protein
LAASSLEHTAFLCYAVIEEAVLQEECMERANATGGALK